MCRREELYADADKFSPERFLHAAESSAAAADQTSRSYVPFLYGPRQCLGHRFAVAEMRAVLAVLLRRFQFDVDPAAHGAPPAYRRRLGVTMRPDPPLTLRVSLVADHS